MTAPQSTPATSTTTSTARRVLSTVALALAAVPMASAAPAATAATHTPTSAPVSDSARALTAVRANSTNTVLEIRRRSTKRAAGSVLLRVADLNARFDKVSDAQFVGELDALAALNPHVILLQETQRRLTPLTTWAKNHGWYLYAPGTGSSNQHESVVLYKKTSRFQFHSQWLRQGSGKVVRENGETIDPRYIASVRVVDTATNRKLTFSSTHTVPEVQFWSPDEVTPRYGTATLAGFKTHVKAVRDQYNGNVANNTLTFLAGDFNSGAEYEPAWAGFMSQTFGAGLISNHEALGQVATFVADSDGSQRSIDYVYTDRSPDVEVLIERTVEVASDHHGVVVDFAITPAG